MKQFFVDTLRVKVMKDRAEMGRVSASDIRERILSLLKEQESIRIIFAAAPSQNDVLDSLVAYTDIPWQRIHAYHMDEYIGLPRNAPQGFGNFLRARIFDRVAFASVNLIDCEAKDAQAECARYAGLLRSNPADIVMMGIGENGHIAFNDPGVADFRDPEMVKVVPLDDMCRQQQVNDGCFARIEEVPKYALTLTCPALVRAPHLFCIVPAATKAKAVERTLNGTVSQACPATILRTCPDATLYLEPASAALLSL